MKKPEAPDNITVNRRAKYDYALGEDWSSDWGVSNFKNSSTWDAIQESHSSSSSDYDSWDSGDTDWDSDW